MKKILKEDYLSEFVYGGIDGIVTTFAVVSAVAGAGYEAGVMLVLGFANLISDGISMGFSSYLAEKTEVEQYNKQRKSVVAGLEKAITSSKNTIKKHLKKYGFTGKKLDEATKTVFESKNSADFIMNEEHAMPEAPESPTITGAMTFTSFLLFGLVPLLPYLIDYVFELELDNLFLISSVLAGLAFAGIGYMKSRVTRSDLASSIIEALILGAIASGASYFIGQWLESIIGVSA